MSKALTFLISLIILSFCGINCCLQNVLKCTKYDINCYCTECEADYEVIHTSRCCERKKSIENCYSRSVETCNCLECSSNYALVSLNDDLKCCRKIESCSKYNFEDCSCIQCSLPYLLKSGTCKCNIFGCETCATKPTTGEYCSKCTIGYGTKEDDNSVCLTCLIDNCKSCTLDNFFNPRCNECNSPYVLTNGQCKKCSDIFPYCYGCNHYTNMCDSCKENYYLFQSDDGKATQCKLCDPIDSFLDGYGKCKLCKDNYADCLKCDSYSCTTCQDGFSYNSETKSCQKCKIENCKSCSNSGIDICDSCLPGFRLDKITSLCLTCPLGCSTCDGNNICSNCLDCNYLDESTICKSCPNTCLSCSSSSICTECIKDYYLSNGNCVKTCDQSEVLNNNKNKCEKCSELFGFDCNKCSLSGCESCLNHKFVSLSTGKCTTCTEPYNEKLEGNKCGNKTIAKFYKDSPSPQANSVAFMLSCGVESLVYIAHSLKNYVDELKLDQIIKDLNGFESRPLFNEDKWLSLYFKKTDGNGELQFKSYGPFKNSGSTYKVKAFCVYPYSSNYSLSSIATSKWIQSKNYAYPIKFNFIFSKPLDWKQGIILGRALKKYLKISRKMFTIDGFVINDESSQIVNDPIVNINNTSIDFIIIPDYRLPSDDLKTILYETISNEDNEKFLQKILLGSFEQAISASYAFPDAVIKNFSIVNLAIDNETPNIINNFINKTYYGECKISLSLTNNEGIIYAGILVSNVSIINDTNSRRNISKSEFNSVLSQKQIQNCSNHANVDFVFKDLNENGYYIIYFYGEDLNAPREQTEIYSQVIVTGSNGTKSDNNNSNSSLRDKFLIVLFLGLIYLLN